MEDVLEVYARPYDAPHPVVCLDEKSKELHATPRGALPMRPNDKAGLHGQPLRQDAEYERHGTANLFCWLEPLTGRCKVRVTQRRTKLDFAEQLRLLVDVDYPTAERVVFVIDNLNTHGPACLYERFEPAEARRIAQRIEWHYTPEHGSWLNMAELELSILSRQCLNRRIPNVPTLMQEVVAWEQRRNATPVQVHWHFTTTDARRKLRRLYPIIKTQGSA